MSEGEPGAVPSRSRSWLEKLQGSQGLAWALLWGLAEGSFFFVVPDVLLTLTALFTFRAALRQTAAVVAGSLLAGVCLFLCAQTAPEPAKAAVMNVPFVQAEMAKKVRTDYAEHGAAGLLLGPLSGIPYKVYAVEAPPHTSLGLFLLASVPARLERLLTGLALFGGAGYLLRTKIKAWPLRALSVHALYWVVVYVFYWTKL